MVKIAENGHIGEEDGRRKKQSEEREPSAAKPKSKGFRNEAGLGRVKIDDESLEIGSKTDLYPQYHPLKLRSGLVMQRRWSMYRGYISISDLYPQT